MATDTRIAALVNLVDSQARRLERQAKDLRRVAAQLRDTVEATETEEDTAHD